MIGGSDAALYLLTMKFMNKHILCAFCVVALLFVKGNAVAQDNVIDRVEWVVGDKSILRSDIEEAIKVAQVIQ